MKNVFYAFIAMVVLVLCVADTSLSIDSDENQMPFFELINPLSDIEQRLASNKKLLLDVAKKSDKEPYCFIEDKEFRSLDKHAFWLMDGMIRMAASIGTADDCWAWTLAMDERIQQYNKRLGRKIGSIDLALATIEELMKEYSVDSQAGINANSFVTLYIDYYRTMLAYRSLLSSVVYLDDDTDDNDTILDLFYTEFSSWYYIMNNMENIVIGYSYAMASYSLSNLQIYQRIDSWYKQRLSYLKVEEDLFNYNHESPYKAKFIQIKPQKFLVLINYFKSRTEETVVKDYMNEMSSYFYEDMLERVRDSFDFDCLSSHLTLLEASLNDWLEVREQIVKQLPPNKRYTYSVVTKQMYSQFYKNLSGLKEIHF